MNQPKADIDNASPTVESPGSWEVQPALRGTDTGNPSLLPPSLPRLLRGRTRRDTTSYCDLQSIGPHPLHPGVGRYRHPPSGHSRRHEPSNKSVHVTQDLLPTLSLRTLRPSGLTPDTVTDPSRGHPDRHLPTLTHPSSRPRVDRLKYLTLRCPVLRITQSLRIVPLLRYDRNSKTQPLRSSDHGGCS